MNVDTANHNFISAQSNNSSNHKDDESSFANPNTHLSLESSHADQPNFVSTLYSTGQNKVPKFLQRLSLYSPDHLDTPETGGSPKTLQLEDNNLSPKGYPQYQGGKKVRIQDSQPQVHMITPKFNRDTHENLVFADFNSPLTSPAPLLSERRNFYRNIAVKAMQQSENMDQDSSAGRKRLYSSFVNGIKEKRKGIKEVASSLVTKNRVKGLFNEVLKKEIALSHTEYDLVSDKASMKVKGSMTSPEELNLDVTMKSRPKLKELLEKHALIKTDVKTEFVRRLLNKIKSERRHKMVLFCQQIWRSLGKMKVIASYARALWKNVSRPWLPQSKKRRIWDIISAFCTIYEIILIPFYIGFNFEPVGFLGYFEFIKDMFFFLDVLVNFHTAYISYGVCYKTHRQIARKYLRTWFTTDLIANTPYVELLRLFTEGVLGFFSNNYGGEYWKYSKFLRLLRIFRWIKIRRIIAKFQIRSQSQVQNGIMNLFLLLLYIVMMAHWIACTWHFVGISIDDDETDSWLVRYNLYRLSTAERYVASLYWAITTMLTVGYGDITPDTMLERIVNILCMLIGCAMFAYSMNSVGIILQSINLEGSKKMQKYYLITKYMKRKQVSKEMQHKVEKYLSYLFENKNELVSEEQTALSLLSDTLQGELKREINGKALRDNIIFQVIFGSKFLAILSNNLEEKIFSPNEVIFDETDTQFAIYFISAGLVELYFDQCKKSLKMIKKDGHFGELSFFTDRLRSASAKSVTFSSIFYITKQNFLTLVENHSTEKEAYHLVKDQINLYNNYYAIKLTCYACGAEGHYAKECPNIHCSLPPEIVIKEYLVADQEFSKQFQRGGSARRRFNARKDCYFIEFQVEKFMNERFDDIQKFLGRTHTRVKSQFLATNPMSLANFDEFMIQKKNSDRSNISHKIASVPTLTKDIGLSDAKQAKKKIKTQEAIEEDNQDEEEKDGEKGEDRRNDEDDGTSIDHEGSNVRKAYEGSPNGHYSYYRADRPSLTKHVKFEFETVKNYPLYFPHNNITKIIESIEQQKLKRSKLRQIKRSVEEMKLEMSRMSISSLRRASAFSPRNNVMSKDRQSTLD